MSSVNLPKKILTSFQSQIPSTISFTNGHIEIIESTSQESMGFINYKIQRNTLTASTILTKTQFKKRGVSRGLLAACLLNHPEITAMEVELTGTNEEVYEKALKSKNSPIEAFKETPAFKIRQALGFSKIEIIDERSHRFRCRP